VPRFHVDVQVPYDVAEQRIATVIADPDGNKACVGTFQPATEAESE
jgi:4a-hydroxytetrahydrobiopterin dehydratase